MSVILDPRPTTNHSNKTHDWILFVCLAFTCSKPSLMPRSHQTFRPVPTMKLLGIMLRNRCWPTTFHIVIVANVDGWCHKWLVWSTPQWTKKVDNYIKYDIKVSLTIWSCTLLHLLINTVFFYQVKMLMFFNVQTTNLIFVNKKKEKEKCTINNYNIAEFQKVSD